MTNTQIDITENGKTTLKTAGKYCDRDIDVNVSVASEQPTPFTNLLTQEDTVITFNTTLSSTAGKTSASNGYVLVEVHLSNYKYTNSTNCDVFRFRGLNPKNGAVHCSVDGGTTWSIKYLSPYSGFTVDEYGDAVLRTTYSSNAANIIIRLTLGFGGNTSNTDISTMNISNCIMTRNEPIGNGGYVGKSAS